MKAIRCPYCDQLHQVTRADLGQRIGRAYYLKTCPTTSVLAIVPADQAVELP